MQGKWSSFTHSAPHIANSTVSRSGHSYDTTVTQEKTEACTHTNHPMLWGRGHSHVSRFPKSNCHLPEISVRTAEKVREQREVFCCHLFVFRHHLRFQLFCLFESDLNKYEIQMHVTLQPLWPWVHPWRVTRRKLLITTNWGCVCSWLHYVSAKYLLNHFAWLLSFLPRNQWYWRWMTAVTWQAWLRCEHRALAVDVLLKTAIFSLRTKVMQFSELPGESQGTLADATPPTQLDKLGSCWTPVSWEAEWLLC